jgi:hypothetical protein
MKLQIGQKVKVFGQETRISQIIDNRVYLRTSIVIPNKGYSVDYCKVEDIQEVDWFEFFGIDDL